MQTLDEIQSLSCLYQAMKSIGLKSKSFELGPALMFIKYNMMITVIIMIMVIMIIKIVIIIIIIIIIINIKTILKY